MTIFLHILPNMENVIFKSVHKTTLKLLFIFKVGETKLVPDFTIYHYKCHFQHFKILIFSINKIT